MVKKRERKAPNLKENWNREVQRIEKKLIALRRKAGFADPFAWRSALFCAYLVETMYMLEASRTQANGLEGGRKIARMHDDWILEQIMEDPLVKKNIGAWLGLDQLAERPPGIG